MLEPNYLHIFNGHFSNDLGLLIALLLLIPVCAESVIELFVASLTPSQIHFALFGEALQTVRL